MKNICFQTSRRAMMAFLMVLAIMVPALAQNITVSGTVYEPDGETAIGVSITQKGAPGVGVVTDIDGNYKISVPSDAVLVASYVGYETVEMPVDGRTHIDIHLTSQSKALEEVVVIGYGTVKKEDATGSVAVIKPSEIEAGLATTAQDMLVGASPGVVVTTTGNPYGEANIRIRGGSSLSASNDPLIVIDGVPMENGSVKGSSNPLALVSPENIESMTILKDASATAIFGSRASNGVIIITTKKGTSGKPQVSFAANMYVNTARKTLDMMDGAEFRNYILSRYGDGSSQAAGLGNANTNWQDEVLRTSISSDYNLSVGGKAGFLPYRVSVSYTNNNGVIKTTSMDRVTGSINLTPKFFDDLLSVNANVKGSYIANQYEQGVLGGAVGFNPTLPVYAEGGNVFNNFTTYTQSGGIADASTPGTGMSDIYPINPVSRLLDYESKSNVWQSVGNIQFDLKMPFLQELRANLNLGYEYNHGKVGSYNFPFSPEAWKAGHYVEGNDQPIRDGYADKKWEKQKRYNLLLDFYLNYNKDLDAINSSLDLTAGYSWQKFSNTGSNWNHVYAPGQSFDGYQRVATYDYSSPYQLVSFFGRAQYGLMGKYLLTATVRRDGSSRFSKDHRWGTFPSVALAWRVIDENFMEGARGVMNDFKIRGTWGITGQQDLGSTFDMLFPYLPIYDVSTNMGQRPPFAGGENLWLVTPQKYNSTLKWEETTTWNVGVDFAFLNNRINGSFDYYIRNTKDLLTNTTYAAGSNLAPDGPMNIGDLRNTGFEFNIVTRPVVTKTFQWTSSLNVAWNKNEITHLSQGADIPTGDIGNQVNVQLQREGQPAFSYFVYEQVYNPDGTPAEGVFVDRNGDGQITEDDKYIFRSRDPKVTVNWQNTINYKNWDFGIVMRGSFGNWMYNKNMADNCFGGDAQTLPLYNLLSEDYCYIFNHAKNTALLCSDYFVQNASYVRCDNITVGYTWENLLQNNLRLRLFGAVQNPFVITKYKGNDPEVFSGIDSNAYPRPVTFTLGLVATF